MRQSLSDAARTSQVHPRDLCRAVDAGELEVWGSARDPEVEIDDVAPLDMQRYNWIPAASWAVDHDQDISLVRQAIAEGFLVGIDRYEAGCWVLEPLPAYATGRRGARTSR